MHSQLNVSRSMKMKDFLNDFKAFAFKGNMMDLAIGMIIGAAFTALVNSVVNNLFMPVLSVFSNLYLPLSTGSKDAFMAGADIATARAAGSVLPYGTFITDLIQFLILAFVVFLMVRGLAKMMKSAKEEEVAEAPTTKECQFCKSEININAVKCPNCTADLN